MRVANHPIFVGIVLAGSAAAADAPERAAAVPEGAPEACGAGVWRLEGAPSSSDEDATFNEG